MENKLLIAVAGSGKTTYLIKKALEIKEERVLITTYTEANAAEIKNKFVSLRGCVPENITIQTWFSFLLSQAVRPYQDLMNKDLFERKIGFFLTEKPSGYRFTNKYRQPVYWGERDFFKYYFTPDLKIYSDKIAQFIIKCNSSSKGRVFERISKIYPHIFIDEVQDLAGWELEIIKLLFTTSSEICLVGDPRQVTYLTHHPRKYVKYKFGKIDEFIKEECPKDSCNIDYETLKTTHRNNQEICDFASKVFPEYDESNPCECEDCRVNASGHKGIFLVKKNALKKYTELYKPTILKWSRSVYPEWNFGKSKGLTFDHVLIHPTSKIKEWLENNESELATTSKCKLYVAITRARYSVGFVMGNNDSLSVKNATLYV